MYIFSLDVPPQNILGGMSMQKCTWLLLVLSFYYFHLELGYLLGTCCMI